MASCVARYLAIWQAEWHRAASSNAPRAELLIVGPAGLLAEIGSTALGEWISVQRAGSPSGRSRSSAGPVVSGRKRRRPRESRGRR